MSPHLSPWPSPVSPPLVLSDSDDDDLHHAIGGPSEGPGPSISRPGSPIAVDQVDEDDVVTCRWEDCGRVFTHLPTLIDHIHNDHIGVHKSNYTCEWATCSRRGLPQTSRFALTSHIRSHTGEKPFTCPRPECDKSFTRSDALAKHMRLQHNISPPLPGRGGSRKRKRANRSPSVETNNTTGTTTNSFNTFKVEASNNDAILAGDDHVPNGRAGSPSIRSLQHDSGAEDSDTEDISFPDYIMREMDPTTGLIFKRPPAMVKYLIEKAKHSYALQEHEALLEELRTLRKALMWERHQKDLNLDEVLTLEFGDEASSLTEKVPPPVGYKTSEPIIKAYYHGGEYYGHIRDIVAHPAADAQLAELQQQSGKP